MASPQEIIDDYKIMCSIEDLALTRSEKLRLIVNIPIMQQERMERLRRFHRMDHVSMKIRHLMMQKVIDLIRNQNKRLETLKKLV